MRQRRSKPRKPAGLSEDGAAFDGAPDRGSILQTAELGAGGRLVIPAPMRAALGMKVGDRLTVKLEGNQVSVYTYREGIRRAQQLMRPYLPENAVDDFLNWKRQQAANEETELGDRLKDE
jgi:AbrB family looped-hinge helix DNA binding protein